MPNIDRRMVVTESATAGSDPAHEHVFDTTSRITKQDCDEVIRKVDRRLAALEGTAGR